MNEEALKDFSNLDVLPNSHFEYLKKMKYID